MGREYHPNLRGFDSYELKLGDELRGERASKGKSLLDVQRDLRIRVDYIDAIENADASAFPFSGFAAGYVRSYARYLGMDGDDVYRRFCEESGFQGVEKSVDAGNGRVKQENNAANLSAAKGNAVTPSFSPKASPAEASVISTRFMKSNQQQARTDLGASLRGMMSVAVLCVLVVGLGYGGWSVLQNLQRVGFAPLPSAPEVHVSAPDIFSPNESSLAQADIAAPGDDDRAALAALYAAQEVEIPQVEPRDGPISSIDPSRSGIYAEPELALVAGPNLASPNVETAAIPVDPALIAAAEQAAADAANSVDIYATADAWVRIRDGERSVLFTGILGPGERFTLPRTAAQPELRAGNAGSVYVVLGGSAYGPLGSGPEVARNVRLTPDVIRATYPVAPQIVVARPIVEETAIDTSVAMSGDPKAEAGTGTPQ